MGNGYEEIGPEPELDALEQHWNDNGIPERLHTEPFFVPVEDSVMQPLRASGFTDAAYKECLAHAVADYAPSERAPPDHP